MPECDAGRNCLQTIPDEVHTAPPIPGFAFPRTFRYCKIPMKRVINGRFRYHHHPSSAPLPACSWTLPRLKAEASGFAGSCARGGKSFPETDRLTTSSNRCSIRVIWPARHVPLASWPMSSHPDHAHTASAIRPCAGPPQYPHQITRPNRPWTQWTVPARSACSAGR